MNNLTKTAKVGSSPGFSTRVREVNWKNLKLRTRLSVSRAGNYSMKESGKAAKALSPPLPLVKHFQKLFCFCSSELPSIVDTCLLPTQIISPRHLDGHVLRESVPSHSQTIRTISFVLSGGVRHGYMNQTWPLKSEGPSVDKTAVVHLHNETVLGCKKEGNLTFCASMEGPGDYDAK